MGLRLGFGLQMQQTQRLIMTPELRQAIAVLQLPVTELSSFIEQELLENPCLEAEVREEEPGADPDPRQLLEYLGPVGGSQGAAADGEEELGFEAFTAKAPTLQEHLMGQLALLQVEPPLRRIGAYLINCLDDNGYLTAPTAEIAQHLKVPHEQVLAALEVVQSLDPVGVGARSLVECLSLQWAAVDNGNPLVPVLIERYLDALGEGRITRIAEELGATPAEVQEAADLIRTLDPKPGRRFGGGDGAHYVVPDVTVERVGQEYVILINEGLLPRLRVSSQYRQMLAGQGDAEARRFVEQKIHSAMWLIKAIEQRRRTLYEVTAAIVRLQRDFFDRGIRWLKPLTLREVAEEVGVHESTVSRATSGKYVQTPQGLYELKFFFSSGVDGVRGEGRAAQSVKQLIADMIRNEDPAAPLSDQALANLLREQGITISRRTVAKYREEAGLPNSSKRRRYV